jgi:cytochrome c oxidase cbb3-type subunit 3
MLAVVAVLGGLLVWAVLNGRADAALVKVDPDDAPANAALMRVGVQRGRAVFKSRCASCHGPEGQGRYTLGAANLTDKDWLFGQGDVSDIENVVLYGIRAPNARTWKLADMPAFARPVPYPREPTMKPLKPGDIDDVIAFMRSLQGLKADPEAAPRGAAIYSDRGGCYDCHAHDARGDGAIGAPNLTDLIWLYGDGGTQWIYDSIAYGRAGVMPAWFDRLSPAQIRAVSLYVYSLSHGSAQPKPSLP